jgi:hypothetical protein
METTSVSEIFLSSIDDNNEYYVKTLVRRMSESERNELLATVTRLIKWIDEVEEESEEEEV